MPVMCLGGAFLDRLESIAKSHSPHKSVAELFPVERVMVEDERKSALFQVVCSNESDKFQASTRVSLFPLWTSHRNFLYEFHLETIVDSR
jgi:hypothetical protein